MRGNREKRAPRGSPSGRRLLVLGLISALLLDPPVARGAATCSPGAPEALREARDAEEHYLSYRFEEAESAYQRAFDLEGAPCLLRKVAGCQLRQLRLVDAVETYRRVSTLTRSRRARKKLKTIIARLEQEIARSLARVELVSSPAGAEVYLEGRTRPLGVTPMTRWLPKGRRVLRAELEGHRSATQVADLKPGKAERVEFQLHTAGSKGTLKLNARPGQRVSIDGRRLETPSQNPIELEPGGHLLRVDEGGHRSLIAQVEIQAGQGLELSPELSQLPQDVAIDYRPTWAAGALTALAIGASGTFYLLSKGEADEAAAAWEEHPGSKDWSEHDDASDLYYGAAHLSAGVALVGALVTGYLLWSPTTERRAGPAEALSNPGTEQSPSLPALSAAALPGGASALVRLRY